LGPHFINTVHNEGIDKYLNYQEVNMKQINKLVKDYKENKYNLEQFNELFHQIDKREFNWDKYTII
jgi:hypothetical protein